MQQNVLHYVSVSQPVCRELLQSVPRNFSLLLLLIFEPILRYTVKPVCIFGFLLFEGDEVSTVWLYTYCKF